MATSPYASRTNGPNRVFRELRGPLSPGEFAARVRRAAREIGERVSCDARYIGRVEAGEIRCPNYAYERVFLHMFPGRSLTDLGFEPRQAVRGRRPGPVPPTPPAPPTPTATSVHEAARPAPHREPHPGAPPDHVLADRTDDFDDSDDLDDPEEGDVLRRVFMTGGPAAVASLTALGTLPAAAAAPTARPGRTEAAALTAAVRDIRLLDDRHGADALYRPAGAALRTAHQMLDAGARRTRVNEELHSAAGELAISVGWLAHDSGRLADARSHYAEALATARVSGDAALEAHAFCNAAYLALDAGRPREAVRAAQAGQQAARHLGRPLLRSLLALREAGAWAALGDRGGCEQALAQARTAYEQAPAGPGGGEGAASAAPEWMSFFNAAEAASLEAGCWAALGDRGRAAAGSRRAVDAALREPHFTRNIALYSAELAERLAADSRPEEAAVHGGRALDLLAQVRSARVVSLLSATAARLRPARRDRLVSSFLDRHATLPAAA
ncbi:hypothetical protein [Streptomyces sp. NPDC049879]|uniref:hypothetical protein n=1 Tax=Streptomyces sp. NPDC049879 TaxID=3365598 RepID=UPI0037B0F601